MTAEFNEFGFRFKYPENWELEVKSTEWPRSVSVHAPSGAFWLATKHPGVDNLLDQVADTVKAEYEDVESSPVDRKLGEFSVVGQELDFYCMDFLVRAEVIRCPGVDAHLVVLTQSENSNSQTDLSEVFDAITFSLLMSSTK